MKTKKPALDQYIDQLIGYFQPRMMMEHYEIEWKWVPKLGKVDVAADPEGASAEVNIDYVYYSMEITLSATRIGKHWKEMNYHKIAETIVHELAHEYTEAMQDDLMHSTKDKTARRLLSFRNEQVTERITHAILDQHKQESWMPKTY